LQYINTQHTRIFHLPVHGITNITVHGSRSSTTTVGFHTNLPRLFVSNLPLKLHPIYDTIDRIFRYNNIFWFIWSDDTDAYNYIQYQIGFHCNWWKLDPKCELWTSKIIFSSDLFNYEGCENMLLRIFSANEKL